MSVTGSAGNRPNRTQTDASAISGTRSFQPTSRLPRSRPFSATSVLVRERNITPKNFMNNASVTALVMMATITHNGNSPHAVWPWMAAVKMPHLLAKPLNSGTPAIEKDAMSAVTAVTGMKRIKPPSLFMS